MIVQLRHSANSGNTPVALANGELALNAVDQLLYYRHANGAILELANGSTLGVDSYARIRANGAFEKANTPNVVIQVSSNVSQIPANTSAYTVTFNSSDILFNASYTPGNTRITLFSSGLYMIYATGTFSRTGGAAAKYGDIWILKNGSNVSGSTVRISAGQPGGGTGTITHALNVNANDYIEIAQAVSATGGAFGLTALPSLDGGPAIPSIKVTIVRVN